MKQFWPALRILLVFTAITGLLYPLAMTGVAQVVFPRQANGSLVERGGRVIGSALIGQAFSAPGYFWSRPSATGPTPYNAAASTGSNWGPLAPMLVDSQVPQRIAALRRADPGNTAPVPVDLVTASGSGLDPDISPAAAEYQVARVARVRGTTPEKVRELVQQATRGRQLGFLGEARVNVLLLNLALDSLAPNGRAR